MPPAMKKIPEINAIAVFITIFIFIADTSVFLPVIELHVYDREKVMGLIFPEHYCASAVQKPLP
jgi:hypothetical protein